jgi:hypothetical protein
VLCLSHRQPVSNPVFGFPRVPGGLQPGPSRGGRPSAQSNPYLASRSSDLQLLQTGRRNEATDSSINEGTAMKEQARNHVNHKLSESDGAPAKPTGAVSGEFVSETSGSGSNYRPTVSNPFFRLSQGPWHAQNGVREGWRRFARDPRVKVLGKSKIPSAPHRSDLRDAEGSHQGCCVELLRGQCRQHHLRFMDKQFCLLSTDLVGVEQTR